MQSADKKPETYVGPDGKTKIRMVPVDREVVKSENSQLAKLKLINKIKRSGVVKTGSMSKNEAMKNENLDADPTSMGNRRLSAIARNPNHPLHTHAKSELDRRKMGRMNEVSLNMFRSRKKSSADDGKPQQKVLEPRATRYAAKPNTTATNLSKGWIRGMSSTKEANTYVGQRDQMKITDRKPHPDGGHIITLQTKAGKTIKRHLKNGKVKDIKEAQLDELTAAEKKLVNQMYDKKGNLTPLGKKVMNHGKKKGDKGFVESLDEALERDGPKKPDIFGPKGSFGKSASTTPAVQKYMAKRAAANRARNKAMDPGADKKGYGIGVTDTDKADKKAKAKGTSMMKRMGSRGKMYKAGKMM